MKTRLLIILFLIAAILGAFKLKAQTVEKVATAPERDNGCAIQSTTIEDSTPYLIADETWLTYSKTGAKITTFEESTFKDISLKWGEQIKSITIRYKTDRRGRYKEYTIYYSKEVGFKIQQWAKNNL